jgi:hypothetical protein
MAQTGRNLTPAPDGSAPNAGADPETLAATERQQEQFRASCAVMYKHTTQMTRPPCLGMAATVVDCNDLCPNQHNADRPAARDPSEKHR